MNSKCIHYIKRKDAIKYGLNKYFQGSECPKGHLSQRYTRTGECCHCAIERSRSRPDYYRSRYKEKRNEILKKNREYNNRPDVKKRRAEKQKEYVKKNRKMVNITKLNYKHRRRMQEAGGVSTKDLREWMDAQVKVCYWCETDCINGFHVDHYIPLSKGGGHETSNMVISCPSCNLQKNSKDPYEFAIERGRLF